MTHHRTTGHETLILQTLRRLEERYAGRLKAARVRGAPATIPADELAAELEEVQVCLELALVWPVSFDSHGEVIPDAMHRLPRRMAS